MTAAAYGPPIRRRRTPRHTPAATVIDRAVRDGAPVWQINYTDARPALGDRPNVRVYWPGPTADAAAAELCRLTGWDPARVRITRPDTYQARWQRRRRVAAAEAAEAAERARTYWRDRARRDRAAAVERGEPTYTRLTGEQRERRNARQREWRAERRAVAQTAHATATAGDATAVTVEQRVQARRRRQATYRGQPRVLALYTEGQRRRRADRVPEDVQRALQRRRERDSTPEARARRNALQRARRARLRDVVGGP